MPSDVEDVTVYIRVYTSLQLCKYVFVNTVSVYVPVYIHI